MSPRKIGVVVLGGALVLVGVAGLVLPGPGLLLILAGLLVLGTEFEWAAAKVDLVRDQALRAAAEGVETWARIALSTLSALAVVAAGVVWSWDPTIPEFWILGPRLPFAGYGTGAAIIVGGLIALVLLGYSIWRFRYRGDSPPSERRRLAARQGA